MLYSLARPILFSLSPERAHELSLSVLNSAYKMRLVRQNIISPSITAMGMEFPNAVGLAAGLDKNGEYIDALAALGFGFIEVGTVTPKPQSGNDKPRLFRLPEAQAIINRMGFNNDGVDRLIENIKASEFKGVLGVNIGKNAKTPVDQAVEDYLICLDKVYNYASYITVNISSPNTKDLRSLQNGEALVDLLSKLKKRHLELARDYQHYVPLVLKVAPDLTDQDVRFISEQLLKFKIDGLIVTNTTLSRVGVENSPYANETGGLSGAPIFEKSTECLRQFKRHLNHKVCLIGVGGITDAKHAKVKKDAGATLIQLYSGLVYKGPNLIKACVNSFNAP